MSEEIKETQPEQPNLFGKVDELRNILEGEMTILTEKIDKAKGQISKLGVKIGSLETRKKNLFSLVKAVKDKEIVLGDGEPQEEEEVFLDGGDESQTESL